MTVDSNAPAGQYNVKVVNTLSPTTIFKYNHYFDETVVDNEGSTVTIPGDERTFGAGTITFSYGSGATAGSCTIQVDNGDTLQDIRYKCAELRRSENSPIMWISTKSAIDGAFFQYIYSTLRGDANRPLSISTSGDESLKLFEFSVTADSQVYSYDNDWLISGIGKDAVFEIDGEVFSNDSTNSVDDPVRGLHITASRTYNRDVRVRVGPATPFPVSTISEAQNTLAIVDRFIAAVDSKRAELGAVQNRLESAIRNQASVSENVAAARSRIRDADFATESAAMVRQNILQKAAQSILSQANQRPGIALALLQK
nr:flagellin [Succinimonas amylolytica]